MLKEDNLRVKRFCNKSKETGISQQEGAEQMVAQKQIKY